MSPSKSGQTKVSLAATRTALDRIREPAIREDLLRFVTGAEFCLQYRENYLALDAVKTLVTTIVALDRTITPEVTAAILDGLVDDSANGAVALQRGLGFTKNEGMKCDIVSGTGPGSSRCVASRKSTCYTLDSGSGCGGTSGFRFVWEAAMRIG